MVHADGVITKPQDSIKLAEGKSKSRLLCSFGKILI